MKEDMVMRTVLLLGANGFVGSHLANAMAELPNIRIVCFDRFTSEPRFETSPNIVIRKGDIFSNKDIAAALEEADYLFHCFSMTNPVVAETNPYADLDTVRRNVEIFEMATKANIKKIAYVSSGGAVYGNIQDKSITEDDMPWPLSPYGIGKLASEHYLTYFQRKFDMPYIVYRLTNPYGPGQILKQGQGVIPAFMDNINHGRGITIYGDSSNTRDFIFIEDAAEMMASTFMEDNKHPVYNIGSGQQVSLGQIIETLGELTGKEIKVTIEPAPKTAVNKISINMERFWQEFGKPELTPFSEGIKRTAKYAGLI